MNYPVSVALLAGIGFVALIGEPDISSHNNGGSCMC